MVRQLRAGGCPEEELAKLAMPGGDGDDFEIWPENADALRAFLFSETQWNVVATFGGAGVYWIGLKYEAVERSFKNHPAEDEVDAWDALRVMEAEAVRLRNNHAND